MMIRASTSLGGILTVLLAASAASAQEVPPPVAAPAKDAGQVDGSGLEDIVVTAQKSETNLQRTPIAIAVLDASDLADRHIQSLADIGSGTVPSLRVATFAGRKSALVLNIRGVGALGDPNQPARDLGVGVYVDGVYLGRSQGLGAALFDIERIEVLKGPQGTLFGRNTEGGAISIVTRKPSGEFRMEATGGISNYGGYEAIAHLDLPSFYGLSLKFDGVIQRRGGTIDNPLAGQPDFNSFDRRGLRIGGLWEPAPNFSAQYAFDASYDGSTPDYTALIAPGSLPIAPATQIQPRRASVADYGIPFAESVGKSRGHLLLLDWRVSDRLTVKAISSYRSMSQSQFDNAPHLSVFAPNANFGRLSIAHFWQDQYSEEVQLLGDLPGLTFVTGAFYMHESVRDDAFAPNTLRWNADGTSYSLLPAPVSATPFPDRASVARSDSAALFGQATWTPGFSNGAAHLTLGGRFSNEVKSGTLEKINGFLPVLNGVSAPVSFRVRSDRFDPLVNLSFDASRDIHLYAKWSTGYRSGGANSRSLTFRTFGPETVSEFEIGAKTEFFDRHVRLNLAAYTGVYKDAQIDFAALIPGANRGTTETVNSAGSGRIKGVEADLTVNPFRGLTISASYAYNSVRLPDAPNPFVLGSPISHVFPVFAPQNAANAAIDYVAPVGSAKLKFHLDGSYSDGIYQVPFAPSPPSDSSFLVNGRLSLAEIPMNSAAKLEVALWSRNLLNEEHSNFTLFNAALGKFKVFNEPRTFGVQGTVRF
jgi:iron complex outermembrane receptor protein